MLIGCSKPPLMETQNIHRISEFSSSSWIAASLGEELLSTAKGLRAYSQTEGLPLYH